MGGIDAYDQFARCSNADKVFLQESDAERLSSTLEMSRAHRINSGSASVTVLENGCISARTEFPLESATGTVGANCTYAEHLAHFYADKGLWSYSDIEPVENTMLRSGLTVKKDGAASEFKSAFKADADAVPPKIDVFFYAEASGSSSESKEEDEDAPPRQDAAFEKQADEQKKGIYFCTIGRKWDGVAESSKF